MSRRIGGHLPPALLARFQPDRIHDVAERMLTLVTVGSDHYPHPAMLSHFEVVAPDAGRLRLATYHDSTTTRNLRSRPQATVVVVDTNMVSYIKGIVAEVDRKLESLPDSTLFELGIRDVYLDEADADREGAVHVTSGMKWTTPSMARRLAAAPGVFKEMMA